jgi:hypothetical protein
MVMARSCGGPSEVRIDWYARVDEYNEDFEIMQGFTTYASRLSNYGVGDGWRQDRLSECTYEGTFFFPLSLSWFGGRNDGEDFFDGRFLGPMPSKALRDQMGMQVRHCEPLLCRFECRAGIVSITLLKKMRLKRTDGRGECSRLRTIAQYS